MKRNCCLQRRPSDPQDPAKHWSFRQIFSDKLSFLAVMPLGIVVLSRCALLGVSERDILHFRKCGYADMQKRGLIRKNRYDCFPVSSQFIKEIKHLFQIQDNCFNHFGVARVSLLKTMTFKSYALSHLTKSTIIFPKCILSHILLHKWTALSPKDKWAWEF